MPDYIVVDGEELRQIIWKTFDLAEASRTEDGYRIGIKNIARDLSDLKGRSSRIQFEIPGKLLADIKTTVRVRKETKRIADVRDIQYYWQTYVDLPEEIPQGNVRILIVEGESDAQTTT